MPAPLHDAFARLGRAARELHEGVQADLAALGARLAAGRPDVALAQLGRAAVALAHTTPAPAARRSA